MKWFIVSVLAFVLLWYGLQRYWTEEKVKQSAPVRYTETLQQDEQKARDAEARSQEALESRVGEYQKGQ